VSWVVSPPANSDEADERVHAVGLLAINALDVLEEASTLIAQVATPVDDDAAGIDPALLELASDLTTLRSQLIELLAIRRATLPREKVDDLRDGFRLAGLAGPEHEAKRKEITERVAGHEVERLAELSPEEAKALREELTSLEPKF